MAHIGQDIPPKQTVLSEGIMIEQEEKNQAQFTSLNQAHEDAERDVDYLRQALTSAEVRLAVIAAAVDRLNAPQATAPALR